MSAPGFRGPRQTWNALCWSMQGLRAAWRHEASFRLEAGLVAVLLPLGLWLGDGALEKLALITAPLLVVDLAAALVLVRNQRDCAITARMLQWRNHDPGASP